MRTPKSLTPTALADLAKVLGAAVVGSLVTLVGAYLTFYNNSRDLDIKLVEIGLSMLSGEKGVEESGGADFLYSRKFALRLLEKYSGIDIPPEEFDSWADSGRIDFGSIPASASWADYLKGLSSLQLPVGSWSGLIERQAGSEIIVDGDRLLLGVLKDGDSDILYSPEFVLDLKPEMHCKDGDWLSVLEGFGLNRARFDAWVVENCPGNALSSD